VARYSLGTIAKRVENKLALLDELGLPVREDVPLVGMVTRLVDQKGCDIAVPVVRRLLRGDGGEAQFVLLGLGLPKYHAMFSAVGADFFDRARVFLKFDDALSHRLFAASDIFFMPSLYEPCGTGQLAAMRYGSVPVVRNVGGLADTVQDFDPVTGTGTGFTFQDYEVNACWDAMHRALSTYHDKENWLNLQRRCMATDFSWAVAAPHYVELYLRAIQA
jgi:starch synthase